MLTESDREILKPVLGNRYSADVLKILRERNITKSNGKPFGNGFVIMVFNGYRDNLDVELALWELRDRIQTKNKRLKNLKKEVKEE